VQLLDERESAPGETTPHLLSLVSASSSRVAVSSLHEAAIGEEKMFVQLAAHLDPISLCALASRFEQRLLHSEEKKQRNRLEQLLENGQQIV
jgi:hypothetical protein